MPVAGAHVYTSFSIPGKPTEYQCIYCHVSIKAAEAYQPCTAAPSVEPPGWLTPEWCVDAFYRVNPGALLSWRAGGVPSLYLLDFAREVLRVVEQPSCASSSDDTVAKVKGTFGGRCARTACQQPDAEFFNRSTERYYCAPCAVELNRANPDAWGLYGSKVCVSPAHSAHPHFSAVASPEREERSRG
jgi:hypothetical protein